MSLNIDRQKLQYNHWTISIGDGGYVGSMAICIILLYYLKEQL